MTPNPHALRASKMFAVGYHDVRVAVNKIVNAGWDRNRAELYVDQVLSVGNDLSEAVAAVLREAERV